MRTRALLLLVLFMPLLGMAQASSSRPEAGVSSSRLENGEQTPPPATAPFNAPTLAVLLANRPAHLEQAKWLEMMAQPVNRSLHPLRITQAMLDTLDAAQFDRRYQYVMVHEEQ